MDFLKNLLVSVPGCGGVWVWGPPCLAWWVAVEPGPLLLSLAGSPWWLVAYHGGRKLPVTQGKEEQTSGPERTVCGGGPGRPWHRVRGEGLSLAWRTEVGVLARDGAGLPSALLWQGFSALCQGLRGPAARCRLCAGSGGVPRREREGLGSWASAWVQTLGAGPASPVGMCGARRGPGRGLCPVSEPRGCVVSVTLGVGMCDVPGWPGESAYFAEQDCARRLCGSLVSAPPGPVCPSR